MMIIIGIGDFWGEGAKQGFSFPSKDPRQQEERRRKCACRFEIEMRSSILMSY